MEEPERVTLAVATVMASGLLWAGTCMACQQYLDFAHHSLGVDLLYLPAGVRLLLVLVFGLRGAMGVAVSHPIPALMEYGQQSALEVITSSIISGFVPLLAVAVCCRSMNVRRDLSNLWPRHLLASALAVSVVTPVAFTLHHIAFGVKRTEALLSDLPALVIGDLAGCLVILLPIVLVHSLIGEPSSSTTKSNRDQGLLS